MIVLPITDKKPCIVSNGAFQDPISFVKAGDDVTYPVDCVVENEEDRSVEKGTLYFTRYINNPVATAISIRLNEVQISWPFISSHPADYIYVKGEQINNNESTIVATLSDENYEIGISKLEIILDGNTPVDLLDPDAQIKCPPEVLYKLLVKVNSLLDDLFAHYRVTFPKVIKEKRLKTMEFIRRN